MDSMRIPFRFRGGEIEKVVEGTDEYYAQLLALTAQIAPGELPLTPEYGVNDPTFNEEAKRQLAFIVGSLVPEIVLTNVEVDQDDTGKVGIQIGFTRRVQQ
jgi:hypothetical protein